MRALSLPLMLVSGLFLSACETNPKAPALAETTYEQALNNPFNAVNYNAVGELMKRYQGPASASNTVGSVSGAPFIVTTLVNIDQLEQSSTLGRLISEQVTSRMAQMGFGVVELKVRNGVYMKRNEGEFLLTREIKEVASAHKAQAVIVGTYAESSALIYVSLKLVNPANSMILAAHDYALPMDRQIRSMLRKGAY
ncbi:MAG: FlgO family outer membrane protein [Azonexus sp.]|nr:FlgO family outer membrane protein [Azonexus sp.]MDP3637134.1 FlgO family outer membrane protein [Azonexus sp.]MDZ4315693.1 FlgO family outer membrane protein [Azonexus sp.]